MPIDIETVGNQLREKIGGKFQITSTPAGLCFTTISIQLTFLFQSTAPPLLPQSIAVMFASLVLYCWGLYRLDALTMPKRFWIEGDQSKPPPADNSSALTNENLWALKHRMVGYWLAFTVVAVALTAAALLLMMAPCAPCLTGGANISQRSFFWTCGAIVLASLYCRAWYVWELLKEKRDPNESRQAKAQNPRVFECLLTTRMRRFGPWQSGFQRYYVENRQSLLNLLVTAQLALGRSGRR
jgi:hypothetical protein